MEIDQGPLLIVLGLITHMNIQITSMIYHNIWAIDHDPRSIEYLFPLEIYFFVRFLSRKEYLTPRGLQKRRIFLTQISAEHLLMTIMLVLDFNTTETKEK